MSASLQLPGTPSDDAPDILATGRSGITKLYASLSERHPTGEDAAYLTWHTLDHRPEQYRLSQIKASLRVVSTEACRAARAAADTSLDATDHVMTYFFSDQDGLVGFSDLAVALRDAGRMPYLLPSVQRAVYSVQERTASPRVKVGADVLPWFPVRGLYLLVEAGAEPVSQLVDVPGVAGVWSGESETSPFASADAGLHASYLFLDDDPVDVAHRLRPILRTRWESSGVEALLAAPFYRIAPYEWDRYLP